MLKALQLKCACYTEHVAFHLRWYAQLNHILLVLRDIGWVQIAQMHMHVDMRQVIKHIHSSLVKSTSTDIMQDFCQERDPSAASV